MAELVDSGRVCKKEIANSEPEYEEQSFQKYGPFSRLNRFFFQLLSRALPYAFSHHRQEGLIPFPLKSGKIYSLSAWGAALCSPMYQNNQ